MISHTHSPKKPSRALQSSSAARRGANRNRRAAATCVLAALTILALCLSACAQSSTRSEQSSSQADDAPGKIRVLANSVLRGQANNLTELINRYEAAYGGEEGFEPVEYADTDTIAATLAAADAGTEGSFDLVLAPEEVIDSLQGEGYVGRNTDDGGSINVATVTVLDYLRMTLIRAAGSTADLPPTDLLDGSGDRVVKLPDFEGTIAIASEQTWQGKAVGKMLYEYGFYSEESGTGGAYSDEVASHLSIKPDIKAIAESMRNGECDLGIVFNTDTASLEGVEECRDLGIKGCPRFKAGVVKASQRKNATRGFVNWLAQQV